MAEFETEALSLLTDLRVHSGIHAEKLENIVSHLGRLNGSVAKHEQTLNDLMMDKVRGAERAVSDAKWFRFLRPVVWLALGMIGVLILENAQTMLKMFLH